MSQTREKRDSLVLNRADFWMIWRCHGIPCFHFYFLFRNNGYKRRIRYPSLLWQFSFKNVIPKVHSYVQSSFSTFMRHLENGIWKTRCNWRFYGHGWTLGDPNGNKNRFGSFLGHPCHLRSRGIFSFSYASLLFDYFIM